MLKIAKIISLVLLILFLFYLSLPSPDFPGMLPNSIQSFEPADIETPLRRGYYTDYSRQEVMNHYFQEFQKSKLFGLPFLTYKLNYPPEDAQTLIRDQARSTYLEEIVHPFRESIFINGFEPKQAKDVIQIDGKFWNQKVIVRYYPSNVFLRLTFALISAILIYFLGKGWFITIKTIKK
jgi:hypothetical protein